MAGQRKPNNIDLILFEHLLSHKAGFNLGDTYAFFKAFKELIKESLIQNKSVYLDGFATFYIKKRNTSMLKENFPEGSIPKTADYMYSTRCKMSKAFKKEINENKIKADELEKEETEGL